VNIAVLAASALLAGAANAAEFSEVATRACDGIAARVDAQPGTAAVFLRSYDAADGGEPHDAALRSAAFVYDNALAAMALLACGKSAQAARVGAALRIAVQTDTRLRNAYRAGAAEKVLPNGWWDASAQRWAEDPVQSGTATGNVAWAALALVALGDATHDARWGSAAQRLAGWIVDNAADTHGAGGFSGGVQGFDPAPTRLFARLGAGERWLSQLHRADAFVAAQWDASGGRFFVGTLPDGVSENRTTSGLDAQLWPQLLEHGEAEWVRAVTYAERAHGVDGGFDFNADRDGVWVEGTAQAALVYRALGRKAKAQRAIDLIATQFASSGLVYATREPRITTGLATGPGSTTADFYYYRLPHLGATAWTALAALGWNPLTGRSVLP